MLHTATYDAWAAYDPTAKVTRPDGPKQQTSGNTLANKEAAISYAAARVLNDLFPVPSSCSSPPNPPTPFCPIPPSTNPPSPGYKTPDTLLTSLGYPVNTTPALPTDTAATPAGVGNLAAKAVLDFRHGDGSNQLNGYADTTYTPANQWNKCRPLALAAAVRPDSRRRRRRPTAGEEPEPPVPGYHSADPLHAPESTDPAVGEGHPVSAGAVAVQGLGATQEREWHLLQHD